MNTPTYHCSNGFGILKTGTRGIYPLANWPRTSKARVCTSACCLTVIGGRLHRCGFLAEVKKEANGRT